MAVGEVGQGSLLGLLVALIVPLSIALNTTVASAQRGSGERGIDTTVVLPLGCLAMLLPAALLGGVRLPGAEDMQRLALMGLLLPLAYFLIQTCPLSAWCRGQSGAAGRDIAGNAAGVVVGR